MSYGVSATQVSQLGGEGLYDITECPARGVVEQPAMAGDILVQDMMILHGSPPKRSPGTRRTIYVELRPVEGVLESEAQSEQWVGLRKRWMGMVLKAAGTTAWPVDWRLDYPVPADMQDTQ